MTAEGFKPPSYYEPRRTVNPVIFIGTVLLGLVLLGGGLTCVLGIGPFAPAATASPGPIQTPRPSANATTGSAPTGSDLPTIGPITTDEPIPTPTQTPRPPNDDTERLLLHVPELIRGTCSPGVFSEPTLAAVDCAPEPDIAVSYRLYADAFDLYEDYDRSVVRAAIERDSGRCYDENAAGGFTATTNRWPSEHEYTLGGQPIGRYLCNVEEPPSITWTDDRLHILGVATSPTGNSDRLVSFWAREAGPLP
jgi:hypothetical protein